jgi:hypothetical protein
MGYYIRVGVAVVVLPGTGAVLAHVGINPNSDPLKNWVKVLAVFWALAPPVWFLGEWYCFEGSTKTAEFEAFKFSQDRAKDVWLGIALALAVMYASILGK